MSPSSSPSQNPSLSVVVPASPFIAATPRPWLWAGAGVALFLLGAAATAVGLHQAWRASGKLAPRVAIAGVQVGGLTPSQAKVRLIAHYGAQKVTLRAGERDYQRPLSQLGGAPQFAFAALQAQKLGREDNLLTGTYRYWTMRAEPRQFALQVNWNAKRLQNGLHRIAVQEKRAPQNARLQVTGASVQIVGGQSGRALDEARAVAAVKRHRLGAKPIALPFVEVAPQIGPSDLQGRDVQIGVYPTRFNAGLVGRTRNLHIGAQAIDGTVLMPGESFSFNAKTGERTWDKGYRMAHIFARQPGQDEAQVVDGLAGGVCQVSSTLYNAIRRANAKFDNGVEIVERNHHSLPVPYVPRGLDATVAWPLKDFRFRNTLPHPIYLRAAIDGSRLTVSVWARVPDSQVPAQTS